MTYAVASRRHMDTARAQFDLGRVRIGEGQAAGGRVVAQAVLDGRRRVQRTIAQDGRLLIATGLEGALDVLTPEDAEAWTIEFVRPILTRFQEAWDGDGALAFWLPSGERRIVERAASAAYDWRLPTGHGGRTLPLSVLIFSGADDDLQQIMDKQAGARTEWIGLYHPRVS